MASTAEPRTKAHIVLGAGGARTIAYAGALETIAKAGIEFASISACSAGSLIGAFVASGAQMSDVCATIDSLDLRRLLSVSRTGLPGLLRYASCVRWPFAAYDSEVVVRIMDELVGEGRTFADLSIPFATVGIDLLSQELLVYASETHADMRVADAVRIAVSIPPLFPPHEAGGRVVVDAGFVSECPIWMVGRFDDEYPIVAIKPTGSVATAAPRRLDRFLFSEFSAGAACRDRYLINEIPRVRLIDIPVGDLEIYDVDEAQKRKHALFETGRRVATECLRVWGDDLSGRSRKLRQDTPRSGRIHDDRAIATASAMMQGFANKLSRISRHHLFISYSHQDKAWLEVIKSPLEPYCELHGMQVWDDTRIDAGELWRDAIARALATTRVALLLVSPSFLASQFIRNEELTYFLATAARNAVKVRWVLLSHIGDAPNPLADHQSTLDMSIPLDTLPAQDLVRALVTLARKVVADLDEDS